MTESGHHFLAPLGEIFGTNPTKPLFHYTTIAGLRGIIESRTMWATDARFLNDWSEVRYIASIAGSSLERRRDLEPERGDDLRALHAGLNRWVQSHYRSHGVYVCSLSENGNQLSQWRGYCPDGGGVSIGFDSVDLHTSLFLHGVVTVKVCYEAVRQQQIVDGILDHLLHDEISEAYMGAGRLESMQEEFLQLLSMSAPLLKHPGFKEEAEWRLIYSTPTYLPVFRHIAGKYPDVFENPPSPLKTEYRVKDQRLIPYVSLPLTGNSQDQMAFDSVILGPSAEPELFEETMKGYLRSAEVVIQSMTSSGIPLRVP
ncbi:DUF2971 domain-containing protein [Acidicapsa dinghuensis]|uniref:DUF2971 domain-containing protein n=1 Tax=Acidicapsa dinghuensis TaxID=2218256 RepID=A0ABW1ECX7_9BACT|nr:DUF2971 domain-containing protein [Acidicapsa dinghuensis]